MCCTPTERLLIVLTLPLAVVVLSIGYRPLSALAPAQRAGAQRLCALAPRDISRRRATSVANGGIAEIDGPPSVAEDDARDPLPEVGFSVSAPGII